MLQRHTYLSFTSRSSLIGQVVRYFGVALVGLVVDFSLVIIATGVLGWHYLISAAAGFMAGLLVTFVLSNAYVFGVPKTGQYRLFITFGLIGLTGLLLLSLLMWLFTDVFGWYFIISKAVATVFVFGWNFLARKRLYRDETTVANEVQSA